MAVNDEAAFWSILAYLISGLVFNNSNLFKAPITNCNCNDLAKTCERILYLRKSIIIASAAIKAPVLAIDLANVAKYTSI